MWICRVDNLEWCDNSGNQIHAFSNGKQKGFENHPKATLKNTDVAKIKSLIIKGFTNSEISLGLNISTSKIMDIRRGKSWKNLSMLLRL